MGKILISTANTEESRIAVIEHELLTSYLSVIEGHVDRKQGIFSGVVESIATELNACYVNIGDSDKKGLLKFTKIAKECLPPGKNSVEPGMRLLVQVLTDSHGKKGPACTSRIKLSSKNLCLMPREDDPRPLILPSPAKPGQYPFLAEALEVPAGFTIKVLGFSSLELPTEKLERQKDNLLGFWQRIQQAFNKATGPYPIYDYSNIVNICLTEHYSPSIDEIVCDDARTLDEIKKSMKVMQMAEPAIMRVADPGEPVFDNNILQQIDTLQARKVKLKSGGEIVIDVTEALIAIDINSQSARKANKEETALHTNIEAATEICRQMRLRNLSGQIVIDFIGMKSKEDQQKLMQHFKEEISHDQASPNVGKISKFNLLELTRQNIGRPLHEAHPLPCAHCDGTGRGFTSLDILARVKHTAIGLNPKIKVIYAELPFDIATDLLNNKRQKLDFYHKNNGIEINIIPSSSLKGKDFRILPVEKALSMGDLHKYKESEVSVPPYLTSNIRKEVQASINHQEGFEMIHAGQQSQDDISSTSSISNKKKKSED